MGNEYGGAYTGQQIDEAIGKVRNGEVYSTEETRIGTWIDGKPLYRICFISSATVQSKSFASIKVPAVAIDIVTRIYGNAYTQGAEYEQYLMAGPHCPALYMRDENVIRIYNVVSSVAQTFICSIIFEYTKTTDPVPTSQTTLLTSKINIPQSTTLSSQETGLNLPVTVTLPNNVTVASTSSSCTFASVSSNKLKL